jgi:hypothetical protein
MRIKPEVIDELLKDDKGIPPKQSVVGSAWQNGLLWLRPHPGRDHTTRSYLRRPRITKLMVNTSLHMAAFLTVQGRAQWA